MGPEWITATVALLGVPTALYQYWKFQEWKRAEWVAQEIKEFLDDPAVINALRMLDCDSRTLPLIHPMATPGEVFAYKQDMLVHALSSDSKPQERDFTKEEVSIRDCFDRLLDRLERFQHFVDAKLVTKDDLKPYLQYWLRIIGDEKNSAKTPVVRQRLLAFIKDYEYSAALRLINSCKDADKADAVAAQDPQDRLSVQGSLGDGEPGGAAHEDSDALGRVRGTDAVGMDRPGASAASHGHGAAGRPEHRDRA